MNFAVSGLHADNLRDAANRNHASRDRTWRFSLRVRLWMRRGGSVLVIGGGES
jgi:hypothetical protein